MYDKNDLVNTIIEKVFDRPLDIILSSCSQNLSEIEKRIGNILNNNDGIEIKQSTWGIDVLEFLLRKDEELIDLIFLFIGENPEIYSPKRIFPFDFNFLSNHLKDILRSTPIKEHLKKKIETYWNVRRNKPSILFPHCYRCSKCMLFELSFEILSSREEESYFQDFMDSLPASFHDGIFEEKKPEILELIREIASLELDEYSDLIRISGDGKDSKLINQDATLKYRDLSNKFDDVFDGKLFSFSYFVDKFLSHFALRKRSFPEFKFDCVKFKLRSKPLELISKNKKKILEELDLISFSNLNDEDYDNIIERFEPLFNNKSFGKIFEKISNIPEINEEQDIKEVVIKILHSLESNQLYLMLKEFAKNKRLVDFSLDLGLDLYF